MGLSRRRLTRGVQAGRPSASGNGASVAEVTRAVEVNANFLNRWQREFREGPGDAFPGAGRRGWNEGRLAQLERKNRPTDARDRFLEGVLAAHRGTAEAAGADRKTAVYQQIKPKGTEQKP